MIRVNKIFVEWKNWNLNLFGKAVVVDESLVVEVTSLSMEGIKFPKMNKEKENLIKVNKSNFKLK